MPTMIQKCPSCGGELAGHIAQHCPDRPLGPCGWVRHNCPGAATTVVEPTTGRFYVGR